MSQVHKELLKVIQNEEETLNIENMKASTQACFLILQELRSEPNKIQHFKFGGLTVVLFSKNERQFYWTLWCILPQNFNERKPKNCFFGSMG